MTEDNVQEDIAAAQGERDAWEDIDSRLSSGLASNEAMVIVAPSLEGKSATAGIVRLTGQEAFITNPESDEGKFQNLMLNIMGGLEWQHLSDDEKELCRRHDYDPELKAPVIMEASDERDSHKWDVIVGSYYAYAYEGPATNRSFKYRVINVTSLDYGVIWDNNEQRRIPFGSTVNLRSTLIG